jgi:hypothetical protein
VSGVKNTGQRKRKSSIGFTSQRENYNTHVALYFGVVLNPNSLLSSCKTAAETENAGGSHFGMQIVRASAAASPIVPLH